MENTYIPASNTVKSRHKGKWIFISIFFLVLVTGLHIYYHEMAHKQACLLNGGINDFVFRATGIYSHCYAPDGTDLRIDNPDQILVEIIGYHTIGIIWAILLLPLIYHMMNNVYR